MDTNELLMELDRTPGDDLEQKLVTLVKRFQPVDQPVETADDAVTAEVLQAQIDRLKEANDRLEETVTRLRNQVTRVAPEPVDHTYTIEQFMLALATKLGRTYGWRTDYARASKETPGSHEVALDDIQKWQKDKRVPEWAFTQIETLEFHLRIGRSGPEWKPSETQYLIEIYRANPRESNASFASKCVLRFGRDVSEQAIKGAIYRLGQQGRLPAHRPPKQR
jgi:hypothetical protein